MKLELVTHLFMNIVVLNLETIPDIILVVMQGGVLGVLILMEIMLNFITQIKEIELLGI